MITVNKSAANKLNLLIKESEFNTPFVRVAVKGGGCSGLSYDLSFDSEKKDTDTLVEDKTVKILVDKIIIFIFCLYHPGRLCVTIKDVLILVMIFYSE